MPRFLANLATKLKFSQPNSLKFTNPIHSTTQKEFERGPGPTNGPTGFFNGPNQQPSVNPNRFERGPTNGPTGFFNGPNQQPLVNPNRTGGLFDSLSRRSSGSDRPFEPLPRRFDRDTRPLNRDINFVRGLMQDNPTSGTEQNADIVHIKIMRNNTFVTVTDSKGNKKMGASAGSLAEMKGGPKVSKYAAEATAEHVGRVAKSMGLKSVVVKVNGFTFFKRKKLAILGFRDGYTHSRSDRNPVVYIEDTTRKPHNGCRLRKQRRV